MLKIRIAVFIGLLSVLACRRKSDKYDINLAAIALNDRAVNLFSRTDDENSSAKAIHLLDSATDLDSNYYIAYHNKLIFLIQLKLYNKAKTAANSLVRLKPDAFNYWYAGIVSEQLKDTGTSHVCFLKSLKISSEVLDTMKVSNKEYDLYRSNKAMNLIMLGRQEAGHALLKQVYENQTDSLQKKTIFFLLNKNRTEILNDSSNQNTFIPSHR